MKIKLWQWVVLALPIAFVVMFLMVAAGVQIHAWRLNWIWAVFTVLLVGWRWLLVQWTSPAVAQIEEAIAEVKKELETPTESPTVSSGTVTQRAEAAIQQIVSEAQDDPPIWEDWTTFWQRCQIMVVAIAQSYHPEVPYPLLNIYVPQAYGLIRGTVDDMDQWMQKLSPVLNQLTVGQAYQAYEMYQKLEPSTRKLWQAWNWAQWVLNPAAALARAASQRSGDRATQQLLGNLSQLLRETLLRNLGRQAITLYSGQVTLPNLPAPPILVERTQTLRDLLSQAEPVEAVEQAPVNLLLVGRTGAGKSSLINTLFEQDLAAVDLLPSTDQLQRYVWNTQTGDRLTLWDTPGYEQAYRDDFRKLVLSHAAEADAMLLVTPALDPALQMDVDFLADLQETAAELPVITVVTQVDRLRPIREWTPPYDWQWGDRPKEKAIREATQYRAELLGSFCDRVLPLVTADTASGRLSWNSDMVSTALIDAIAPAKQLRLARFLRDRDARAIAAAKIIDHYIFQMTTTQGLTALLKSPVLQFIATLTTGSPALAYVLAEQIPVEQLPVVIGKLQMAYELFPLLNPDKSSATFELLSLWPLLLLENTAPPNRNAWAFGHALIEYWTQHLTSEQFEKRFQSYLA